MPASNQRRIPRRRALPPMVEILEYSDLDRSVCHVQALYFIPNQHHSVDFAVEGLSARDLANKLIWASMSCSDIISRCWAEVSIFDVFLAAPLFLLGLFLFVTRTSAASCFNLCNPSKALHHSADASRTCLCAIGDVTPPLSKSDEVSGNASRTSVCVIGRQSWSNRGDLLFKPEDAP